jgi:hypothetical protein
MSFGPGEKVNKFKSSAFPTKAVKQITNKNRIIHAKYLEGILRARAGGHDEFWLPAFEGMQLVKSKQAVAEIPRRRAWPSCD